MVTDIELMSANSRFLSMGLADSADEAANLSRIAVTLGGAMGKEAGPAMEEFALLMANQSIPRLDTFGISAGKVRQRIKDLQAATPGLSRETAFMTATMEEAAVAMEKVGNAVPTDPYTQLEVSVSNLTDAMKMQAADGLGPTLSLIAEGAQLRRDLNEAIDEGTLSEKRHNDVLGIRQLWTRDAIDDAKMLMGEVEESRKVYEDFFRGLEAGDDRLIEAERNQAALAATQEEATEITEEQKKEWLDAALAASEFAGAEDDLVVGADKVAASAITAALHIVEYEQSLLDAEIAAERAAAQADTFMSTLSGGESDILIFNETMAELAEGHQKATVDTDGLTQALFNQLGQTDMTAAQLAIAAGVLGVYSEAEVDAALKAAIMQQAIADVAAEIAAGDSTVAEGREKLLGLAGSLDQAATDALEAESGINAAQDAIDRLKDKTVTVTIKQKLSGFTPQEIAENIGQFQHGGRPPVGRPSIVGEAGPELFVPNTAGTIIPNDKLGGMGTVNITQQFFGGVTQEMSQMAARQTAGAVAEVLGIRG
jgi:hypothetical protein